MPLVSNDLRTVYVLRDAKGAPVYVGCTADVDGRLSGLSRSKWWSDVDTVEGYPVRAAAAPDVERVLIALLAPTHNRAGRTTNYSRPGMQRQSARKRAARPRVMWGAHLRATRETAGLTLADVAEDVGVTYQAVQGWEADLSRPGPENQARLCALFGKSRDELFPLDEVA